MSQPPPYGPPEPGRPQDPHQQPYQPYQPYAPGTFPDPYAQLPQQPNHTTRNVLIAVGLVILLFCGGLITLGALAIKSVGDAIDESFDTDYEGSAYDPLVIEEGEGFEIRGYDYAAGWRFVAPGDTGFGPQIEDLTVTNNRDDTGYSGSGGPSLTFTFYDGTRALAQIDCYTAVTLSRGISTELTCNGADEIPTDYQRLEVYDDALYE